MGASLERSSCCCGGDSGSEAADLLREDGVDATYQPPPLSLGVLKAGDVELDASHTIVLAATYCRNSMDYAWLETPLLHIGSRAQKRSFLVHAFPPAPAAAPPARQARRRSSVDGPSDMAFAGFHPPPDAPAGEPLPVIMSFLDRGDHCPLNLQATETLEALAGLLLRKLPHPFLEPVLDVDFIKGRDRLVLVRRYRTQGSLRDVLCQADPQEAFATKYRRRKTPSANALADLFRRSGSALPEDCIRRFGAQILAGVAALRAKGVIVDHLHCGNLLVDGDVVRITDLENTFLNLPPSMGFKGPKGGGLPELTGWALFAAFRGRVEVDALLFGHVLWEMVTGLPLASPRPEPAAAEAVYQKVSPELAVALRSIFDFDFDADADGIGTVAPTGPEGALAGTPQKETPVAKDVAADGRPGTPSSLDTPAPPAPTVERLLQLPFFAGAVDPGIGEEHKLYLDSSSKKIVKVAMTGQRELYEDYLRQAEAQRQATVEAKLQRQQATATAERERAVALQSPMTHRVIRRGPGPRQRSRDAENPGLREGRPGSASGSEPSLSYSVSDDGFGPELWEPQFAPQAVDERRGGQGDAFEEAPRQGVTRE